MKGTKGTPHGGLASAREAISNLTVQELSEVFLSGQMAALNAYAEIAVAPVNGKTGPFYRYLLPWRKDLVSLLADSYRRYFKLTAVRGKLREVGVSG